MDITRWIWRLLLFSPIKTILFEHVDRLYLVECASSRPKHIQALRPASPFPRISFSTHCVLTRNPAHFLMTRSF